MVGMDWSDVGERIRECRLTAGLSQEGLAIEIGLDRTMVAKIEAGNRRVDALELGRLATALGVPLDHFLRRHPPVLSRRGMLAEDVSSDADRKAQHLEAKLLAWMRDVQQLVDLGTLLAPQPLRYPFAVESEESARSAALWLRDHLDLGTEPIGTLLDVCAKAGQFVLVTDLPGEGASVFDGDVAVAVVSRAPDPGRRRATAAHELGHLVLGDEYSSDLGVAASREDRERAVDTFAAELLLPTDLVAKSRTDGADLRQCLITLAATYRTSWSLAVRQAVSAGVLEHERARGWRSIKPTRAELMESIGWAPQPDLESVRVPPSYAHAVMEAWRQDLVASARAVELMHGQITLVDLPLRADTEPAP